MAFSKQMGFLGCAFVALSTFACSTGPGSDESAPSTSDPTPLGPSEATAPGVKLTPEYVAEVRAQNTSALENAGLFYTLQVDLDHEVMFLESKTGGFQVVERVGPSATGSIQGGALTEAFSPTSVFEHFKPGAEVPGVVADATARLGASTEQTGAANDAVPAEALVDSGYALLPGLSPQHTTSDGNHFQNDTHTFGAVTDTGCPNAGGLVLKLCWLNRTGGGLAGQSSKKAIFHFGIYAGGSTLWGLVRNGTLQWEITVMQGEIWRTEQSGGSAATWQSQWAGGGKSWHFGGTWFN